MAFSQKNKDNPVPSLNFIIIETEVFKIGDMICHSNNLEGGFPFFCRANDYDVENYSGKNGRYYQIIRKNGRETDKEILTVTGKKVAYIG